MTARPWDLQSRRRQIIDQLVVDLEDVQAGASDPWGGTYVSTVRTVRQYPIAVEKLSSSDLPAVFLFLDGPTTFETDSEGITSSAVWSIELCLVVRDPAGKGASKDQTRAHWSLEALFQDVQKALAKEPCQASGADVNLVIDRFDVDFVDDPTIGVGWVSISIYYAEDHRREQ